ncbi:unnamed protein product, partial [Mesorhabditis belari]|uniref:Uncharacterized protein n=1 Tax=Mesorhabditis belari TaxID=2138241 RepID=A0AAF3EZS5_9BILA
MNNPTNSQVEFYRGHQQNGENERREEDKKFSEGHHKIEIEYKKDGRKVVDGKVEEQSATTLWTRTLMGGVLNHTAEIVENEEEKNDESTETQSSKD